MKQLISLPIFFATCMLFGCKKEAAVQSGDAGSEAMRAVSGVTEKARPFKGTYLNTHEVLQPPPVLKQKVSGTGNATHLGESQFTAMATVTIQPPPPFPITGTAIFIAANGDEFHTEFTGTSTPNGDGTSTGVINHTIIGGTGRFENATGSFKGVSVVNPAIATNPVSFEGWIRY